MADSLGEASVDVYADLSRLDSDFRDAKAKTDAFTRDFSSKMSASAKQSALAMRELDTATRSLASAYSPTHAAALRYADDLSKIEVLQKSGAVSANDIAMFQKKAAAAFNESTLAQSAAYQMGEKVGEQLKRYAELAVIVGTAVGIELVHSSLEHATALEEQSRQIGLSTTDLQKWQYIAMQSGVSAEQLNTGMIRLRAAFGQLATGNQEMGKLFTDLKINFKDASFKSLDFNQKMQLVATQLSKVKDADEKAAGGQMLFGRSFAGMLQMMGQGPEKIGELSKSFDELGLALSPEEIQSMRDANIQLEVMKNQLSVDFSHFVANNANAIVGLAKALETVAKACLDFLNAHPAEVAGLLGAIAGGAIGGKIGGLPGAAVGAIAGGGAAIVAEQMMSRKNADTNMDVGFRRQALLDASHELDVRLKNYNSPGSGLFTIRHSSADGGDLASQTKEVQRQTALLKAAQARAAKPESAPTGDLSLSNLHEPKGKHPHEKKTPFDKLSSDELTLQQELLRTLGLHVSNADAKAELDTKLLDIDKQKYMITLQQQVHSKSLTQAEADILKQKYLEVDAAKRHEIDLQKQEQMRKDSLAVEQATDTNESEILAEKEKLATSQKDRYDLEKQLLALQTKMLIATQEDVIASINSSDTQKDIARAKILELRDLEKLKSQELNQQFQGPVADFFQALPKSAQEIQDALQKIRAANLEDVQKRTVQFADDVGSAFGNMANNILNLQSPLTVLKSLLMDLSKVFTQETIVRPIQDWARNKIGGPLAERVVGGNAGPEGLSMQTLKTSSLNAAEKLDEVRLAAAHAAQALNAIPGGALLPGASGMANADNPTGSATIQSLLDTPQLGSQNLADTVTQLGDAAQKASSQVLKFGGDLPQVLSQLLSSMPSGGGGGGGILGTILKVAGAVAGGLSPGGIARSNMTVGDTIASNPGIFHDGGDIGPDAMPVRRRLRPGEVNITAKVGEKVIKEGPAKKFGDMLDTINAGKLPKLPTIGVPFLAGLAGAGGHSTSVSIGDIHFHGDVDDRSARRYSKQIASDINYQVGRAVRSGVVRRD